MLVIPGSKSVTADNRDVRAGSDGRVPPVRTEAVGLLAAGLAHDLNNMLGGIVATAELLAARGKMARDDARDLGAIADQAVKASELVRQILAFSRQDMLNPEVAGLAAMLQRFRPMLVALAGTAIRLEFVGGDDPKVRVDPTALERVTVNLLLNARDAIAGRRGQIRISTARLAPGQRPEAGRGFMPDAAYGVLAVEDNGPGVDPANAARIFEPYFTTRPGGQGLGLASAFGLVKQSGGFLLHDRSQLGGARFAVYLPEAGAAQPRMPFSPLPGGQVVLLVEDDMLLRMSVGRGLERMGYRVRHAADGDQALARLAAERPAVLVSDIRMPGLDGVELTRRARGLYPGLRVLLISGFADEEARMAVPGLDVAFLPKPFTVKTLGERIRELV